MLKLIGQLLYVVGKALGGTIGGSKKAEIEPCGLVDINEASSILLDKMEEIGDEKAEIYLPDSNIKIYNKKDVENALALEEIGAIEYVAEKMDCDDFAALAYGKFLGLVWTNLHAMNWFLDEDSEIWWVEPQTGKLSKGLEGWQGDTVRFFLGR